MAFSGWPAEALDFYDGLLADNSKTYWTEHKHIYTDHVLGPMTALTEELAADYGEPRIFRPYRDLRFSKDKAPYKTAIGAVIAHSVYIQLSAEGLGAGAGMWRLEPDQLARYREAVAADRTGAELTRIVAKLEKDGLTVRGHDELKTIPRGYPADHPRADLLRYKGLTAWQDWPVEPWLGTAAAKDKIISFILTTSALRSWLADHVRVVSGQTG